MKVAAIESEVFTGKNYNGLCISREGAIARIDEILHCKRIYNSKSAFDHLFAPSYKNENI